MDNKAAVIHKEKDLKPPKPRDRIPTPNLHPAPNLRHEPRRHDPTKLSLEIKNPQEVTNVQ